MVTQTFPNKKHIETPNSDMICLHLGWNCLACEQRRSVKALETSVRRCLFHCFANSLATHGNVMKHGSIPLNNLQLAFLKFQWTGPGWRMVEAWSGYISCKSPMNLVFWCNMSLTQELQEIVGSPFAFAAIRADGAVVTWGTPNRGGDSSAVAVPMAALKGWDGIGMFFTCSGKTSGWWRAGLFVTST